jgi:hypothetical protein
MPISTTREAGTKCPPTEVDEVIIKAVMVDGVTITLENENADYWLLPGVVEETVHTFMTTGFKSFQVHPAFKRQVRAIASRQFKAAYGRGYMEREDWHRLFGADGGDEIVSPPPVAPTALSANIPDVLRRSGEAS